MEASYPGEPHIDEALAAHLLPQSSGWSMSRKPSPPLLRVKLATAADNLSVLCLIPHPSPLPWFPMALLGLQLRLSHIMPGLPSVAKHPHTSAIPTPAVMQEVKGQDVSVKACTDNQWRHCAVSGYERYKWCAVVISPLSRNTSYCCLDLGEEHHVLLFSSSTSVRTTDEGEHGDM